MLILGEMGMSVFEMKVISPRELFNKITGHEKAVREKWEQVRMQCYFAFSPIDPTDPEKKRLQPITDFLPFTWEGNQKKGGFEALKQEAALARKQAAKKWRQLDSNKK